jgi:hypothetical protein
MKKDLSEIAGWLIRKCMGERCTNERIEELSVKLRIRKKEL